MLWRAEEHEALAGRPWDPGLAEQAIRAIVADAEATVDNGRWPGHPLDELREDEVHTSLYLGSAGMIWGLWKLGSSLDAPAAIAMALDRYRETPDFGSDAHPPSLLVGETGILAAAHHIGAPAADSVRLRELVHANREHPTWELLWGSPGSILAARACGLSDLWEESAELLYARWDPDTDMWSYELYGDSHPYLGVGHGFAGDVHALRGYVDDDELRVRVGRVLTRTAAREDGLANWPPIDDSSHESPAALRVQWCHGAPGIVATLGDLMPIELAIGGGELTWRAGPLRKGPGLCHGTAGNGYAFLHLHELTGDPLWLERARRFGMHAIEQVERARAQYGRGRYTLWTGDIGTAVYLRSCIDVDPRFPTLDTFA
jgi:hypothetical protein